MHLITNDIQKGKIAQGRALDRKQQELIEHVQQEMSHTVFLDDKLIDPTNSIKQLGKPFTSQEFEKRLSTILPSNCTFIDNPYNPTKRAVIRTLPEGKTETLVPYERGWTPEHSVMQLVEKEIADVDVLSRRKAISRADLPKSEYVRGEGFVFDDTVTRPGFRKIKQVGREITRGWRTVLLKLVIQNIITLTDVERVFGTDYSPNWASHMHGRNEFTLPW